MTDNKPKYTNEELVELMDRIIYIENSAISYYWNSLQADERISKEKLSSKLKQIREILGRQVQPERNEISQKERDEVGLGEKKYILQDVEQPKPDNDELVRRLDEFERKSKAGMTILDIHMFEEIRLKLLQQSKPKITRGEITEWVEISNREYEAAISHIINCLKSKGVEVGE